jgi:hypothetical protein
MGLKKKGGSGDTNVNIFHEDFFFGLHGVFMEHLDCAPIGHCYMDLSEVFIKKIHRYIGEAPTGESQIIIPTFKCGMHQLVGVNFQVSSNAFHLM